YAQRRQCQQDVEDDAAGSGDQEGRHESQDVVHQEPGDDVGADAEYRRLGYGEDTRDADQQVRRQAQQHIDFRERDVAEQEIHGSARLGEQPCGPEQHEDDEDEEGDADAPFTGNHQQREVLQLRDQDRQGEGTADAADAAGDHGDGRGQQRRNAAIRLQPQVQRYQHTRQADDRRRDRQNVDVDG